METSFMTVRALVFCALVVAPLAGRAQTRPIDDDPYAWLEEVDGKKAMDWVKARNAETVKATASSTEFERMRTQILDVLDSNQKIPYVYRQDRWLYNFWRDKQHPRGLWRRTTLEEYRKDQPGWTVLVDVDALAKTEKENWVWHGANCLKPDYKHCLVHLSRGGADAVVVREFALESRTFVKSGFQLPEAKSNAGWMDADTLYVGTDFGPGTMTKSGYPRQVRLWKRGTPLASAKIVYEGKPDDVSVFASRDHTPGFERDVVVRSIDDYHSETFLLGKDGKLTLIDVQKDAIIDLEREWLLVQLRSPWTVGGKIWPAGALLATKLDPFLAGERALTPLFLPTPNTSLASFSWTQNHLIINALEDVVNSIEVLTPAPGAWKREPLVGAPELSTVEAYGSDPDHTDEYFLYVSGYLNPSTMARGVLGTGSPQTLKHSPEFFNASHLAVSRWFARSKDGTRVPYFVVGPKGQKPDGAMPTLLSAYGGFEVSLQPYYSAAVGRAWLERGGTYVVANIRGGGEYGPKWHQAALKANRLRAYEDFAAVAEDLFAKKITSPKHLGIEGWSNGGLLMGNMLTLYPQLFAAVVSAVPLLDMKRYTHLSAGASWIGEYGDPDQPAEWKWLKTFSPYHNAKQDAKYPPVLLMTSTRDDRVGPVHARKMAAKMIDFGHPVQFYENIEGGHGAAADNREEAFMSALEYSFLWDHVK
jgi:prolyl oligopeptidase